jgi:hypothetical protein
MVAHARANHDLLCLRPVSALRALSACHGRLNSPFSIRPGGARLPVREQPDTLSRCLITRALSG